MSDSSLVQLELENAALKKQLEESQRQLSLALQNSGERNVKLAADKSQQDNKLDQLLEIMPAGVVVIDSLGVVEQSNPAAETFLCEQLVGKKWREVVSLCFAPQADDGHEISLKDGRRLSIATTALYGNMGQLVLLSNLTETRRLQSQLAHSSRLNEMGKMMTSLAHQIRTPLSAALLYTGHLTKQNLSDDKKTSFALKVRQRLLDIEHQISDMLIFARGENKLEDKLSVSSLMRELEERLDVPLAQYDADCDVINNQVDGELVCNKAMLVGAILNVVINALQACGTNAQLRIEARKLGAWMVLSVIDNGPGMDEQTLLKVQQPFFTTKSHGTGLGLSVAQVVAKAHSGRFEIASELGKGTVAGFWLPVNSTQ